MDVWNDWSVNDLVERIKARYRNEATIIVGISGSPAAGKSTLVEDLVDELNRRLPDVGSQPCPMDGFHRFNSELDSLGLRKYKGRIDTFDVERYGKFLRRLRDGDRSFYWPIYSRKRHDVISDGIWIKPTTSIFLTEGNYLFVDVGQWREIAEMIDLKIFVASDQEALRERLRLRHLESGKTPAEAEAKIEETDLPNARLIERSQHSVDIKLGWRLRGDFERGHRSDHPGATRHMSPAGWIND